MASQRRHLSIFLPQLPLDRWVRRDDPRVGGPFAVTALSKGADRLICVNEAATRLGAKLGQSLTDANAICPDLLTEPQSALFDARLLGALLRWAGRFSPRVSVVEPDGLALDISGCAHLFGGEAALGQQMLDEMDDLRIVGRLGIANTRGAARGFARFGAKPLTQSDPYRERDQVGRLPLAALDMGTAVYTDLRRLGVNTVEDLSRFKSSELARRFSVRLPMTLDALRGHRPDPVVPTAAPKVFAAQMTLPDPIALLSDVTEVLRRLSERVCTRLMDDQHAARGFQLFVRCVDTGETDLTIGFARPARDPKAILRQFSRPLDTLRLPFGADWFRLVALDTEVFKPVQIVIGDGDARVAAALEQTLTTLGNRLGFDRIRRPVSRPSHAPECEHGSIEVMERSVPSDLQANGLHVHPRPLLAFAPERLHVINPGRPPRRFQWRGDSFVQVDCNGPERVAPIWWEDTSDWLATEVRDYWQVATDTGRRLWLVTLPRTPDAGWFCAGEYT